MVNVLVVDDDPDMLDLVETLLVGEGHHCTTLADGDKVDQCLKGQSFDLVILDVELPGLKGPEICRRIRVYSQVPILFLTSQSSDLDQLSGFNSGGDEYVAKPFVPAILIARINSLLRRSKNVGQTIQVDNVVVNLDANTVLVNGQEIALSKTEYQILAVLAAKTGQIVSKRQLLDIAWQYWYGDDHVIDVNISRLRQKLISSGAPTGIISTHRGLGYRFGK